MYSPKISEHLVRELYKMKHSTAERTPMTKLVNKAVEEFLNNQKDKSDERNIKDDNNYSIGNNIQNTLRQIQGG